MININLKGGIIIWLRRDLRIKENPVVHGAIKQKKKIIFCFVFDKNILDKLKNSSYRKCDTKSLTIDHRVGFLYQTLKEIKDQLSNIGSDLLTFYGDPVTIIPEIANKFCASSVYAANDYESYGLERDKAVLKKLTFLGITFKQFKNQCIFEKSEILTNSLTPYTVFTPYKKKWIQIFEMHGIKPKYYGLDTLTKIIQSTEEKTQIESLEELEFSEDSLNLILKSGNSGGEQLFNRFLNIIDKYNDERNYPAKKGCSYLSVHLRFGTISIEKIVCKLFERIQLLTNANNDLTGTVSWLSEIIWRDFYMQILFNFPHVERGCFKKQYDNIEWENDLDLFDKWTKGETGYPIVDAGMRQLNQTGYMHNRLRMITASFLTKDLGISWQKGEEYFANKLLDFDLSANNGGWQWAASTGCDAQPYFRIFNPTTQSQKFDPNGQFIKKYIPELEPLSNRAIHEPWKEPKDDLLKKRYNYPDRIVKHDEARQKTLERFNKARAS